MNVEVLVSTMNQENNKQLIKDMNITGKSTIINQITKKIKPIDNIENKQHNFFSYYEKGLSKSRNKAVAKAKADICIIADDDMYYESNYDEIIKETHEKHKDADIIAFVVDNEDKKHVKKIFKEGYKGFLQSMKLQSVQITFKRKNILDKKIKFDEEFGAGSTYYWGEENIFLFDCLRKRLKIYYVPKKIATLKISESSWNKDNTEEHYEIQGAIYYRMSKLLYPILILQFAIRKKKIYINDLSLFTVTKCMFKGAKKYKNKKKEI